MNKIKNLIEYNRQVGTTTALIAAALESNGTLVVRTEYSKSKIKNLCHPRPIKILTLYEVDAGSAMGLATGPLFFDTDAIWAMAHRDDSKDGYTSPTDGYVHLHNLVKSLGTPGADGYQQDHSEQFNVKLTKEDTAQIKEINKDFFENEASNSMMGRILIRKGIQFFKNLK